MGKYSSLGLYSKYDKNNKERQKEPIIHFLRKSN